MRVMAVAKDPEVVFMIQGPFYHCKKQSSPFVSTLCRLLNTNISNVHLFNLLLSDRHGKTSVVDHPRSIWGADLQDPMLLELNM